MGLRDPRQVSSPGRAARQGHVHRPTCPGLTFFNDEKHLEPTWTHTIAHLSKVDRPLWAPDSQSLAWIRAKGSQGSHQARLGSPTCSSSQQPCLHPRGCTSQKPGRALALPVHHPTTDPSASAVTPTQNTSPVCPLLPALPPPPWAQHLISHPSATPKYPPTQPHLMVVSNRITDRNLVCGK